MDGVEAFHAAYRAGRMVPAPDDYIDMILVPGILHIDPLAFAAYPPLVQAKIRRLLRHYIAAGWGGNPQMIEAKNG